MDAPTGREGVRGHQTTGAYDQHGVLPVENKRGTNDKASVAGRGEPKNDHHQVRTTQTLIQPFYGTLILIRDFNSSQVMEVVLVFYLEVWRII